MTTVRDFWVFLRSQGVDAQLDLPAAERRQEWPAWMQEQVRDARFVLVVASPSYKRRSDGYAAADEGRGVQFETRLIREFFYRDQSVGLKRFLPVLLPGVSVEDIPDFLSPTSAMHYKVTSMTVDGCESLLRVLTGQPYEVVPPLGSVPVLPPRVTTRPHEVTTTTDAVPRLGQDKAEQSARHSHVPGWSPIERRIPSIIIPPRPTYFSPRKDLLAHARAALLQPSRTNAARMVGLVGMGGVGKSVLARELARDEQISRAYPDGIVWLELGPTPDLLARQAQLAELFGDPRAPFDWQQGLARLNMMFSEAARLVILDNVWKREHLRAFGLLEPKSALLITTRNRGILDHSAAILEIGPLSDEPAHKLLAAWAGYGQASLPPEAQEVAQECGGLPLALAVVGGMVADELSWDHVRERLRRADLHRLEINLDDYRDYQDLLRALDASVSDLPAKQRDRYLDLAVFDGRGDVPVEVVRRLWRHAGLDKLDIDELIIRLARRSLLQRDKGAGTLTLHDLQFDYTRHKLGSQRLRALHARLAEIIMNGWGGLVDDLPDLLNSPIRTSGQLYGALHFIAHLNGAGQHEDIHRLLALNSPTLAIPGQTTRIENTWHVAHDRIGKIAAYVGDVGVAWNLAKESTNKAVKNGESAASIGLEVRYALVTASIASIAASIPPQLLVALVKSRHWTAEQGLAYARQIPSVEFKARTLVQLLSLFNSEIPVVDRPNESIDACPGQTATSTNMPVFEETDSLGVEIAAEALAVARGIEAPSSRARILSALALQLHEPDQAAVVNEAWDAICVIPPGYSRARAIAVLATKNELPEVLHGQALAAARAVDDPSSRASILIALIAQLHGRDRAAAVKEAQAAISTIRQPEARAAALTALIPQLRKPRRTAVINQARDTVRTIPRGYSRAKVLVTLAAQLPGPDRAAAVNDAQTAISTISQPEDRAAALTALIPQLRGRDRVAVMKEAQDAISTISQPRARAAALTALIPQLPKRRRVTAIKEAQIAISAISQPEDRAAALTALIPQLLEPYRLAAVQEAQVAIRAISQPEDRATALTALALQLPEHDQAGTLAQALADARAINDARQRATAFTALAPKLPEWDSPTAELNSRRILDRALADARASADPSSRAITLAILASLMPETDGSAVVRDALKEAAYGVVDASDRAAVLTALAPEIPEPGHSKILDEACAAASEISDPDQRAATFSALVSKVPGALQRQAERVADALDTTYMRSQTLAHTLKSCRLEGEDSLTILHGVLEACAMSEAASSVMASNTRILSRLPRGERLAVFEGARDLNDAVDELHSRASALTIMISEIIKQPTKIKGASAATTIVSRVRKRAHDLNILISEFPEPLRDKAEAAIRVVKNVSSWVEGNPATLRQLETGHCVTYEEILPNESEFHGAITALTFPQSAFHRAAALDNARRAAYAIREPSTRAAALMALLPYVPEMERVAVLDETLAIAKSIDDVSQRGYVLEMVVKHSLTEPILPWAPYWRSVIEDAAIRGRAVLISDLSAIGTIISELGGGMAMQESIHGLLDVGRWWP
jgi:hypothetical protein